jgi:hypothetical protein
MYYPEFKLYVHIIVSQGYMFWKLCLYQLMLRAWNMKRGKGKRRNVKEEGKKKNDDGKVEFERVK